MKKKLTLHQITCFLVALAFLNTSCKEEKEDPISVSENICGSWTVQKKVNLILETGSTWRYVETSKETTGPWIGNPFTFTESGRYYNEYKDEDGYIIQTEGLFALSNDTITMSGIDSFPCRKSFVNFTNTTTMIFTLDGKNEMERPIKTQYYFEKQKEVVKEQAFNSINDEQSNTWTCSAVNKSFICTISIESVSANGAILLINKEKTIVLTEEKPVMTLSEDGRFEATTTNATNASGLSAIMFWDKANGKFKSTTYNNNIYNSVGEVLFWWER